MDAYWVPILVFVSFCCVGVGDGRRDIVRTGSDQRVLQYVTSIRTCRSGTCMHVHTFSY